MRLFIFLLLQFFIFLPLTSLASGGKGPITQQLRDTESQKTNIKKTHGKLPLYFIENQGQVDSRVKIYERDAGHATFFTGKGLILSLTADEAKVDKASRHDELKTEGNVKITTETLGLSFVGANDRPVITAQDRQTGHVNYFVGNDKTKWRSARWSAQTESEVLVAFNRERIQEVGEDKYLCDNKGAAVFR